MYCSAWCECEREDRWWDGIMIMPQHTTNSTTIGTAPRPHLPVSAQTLSSPGPLLLVNCVAWTENWGVICELDVLNNNNSTTAEQMIIGIKYIQSASARVISARQHVQNIGRLCKNWQGGFHKSDGAECGASAQNQATKLFRFFREDDGYNETFAAAKW